MVQNVCGKLQEEAQSELEAQGLYMFVIQEQKSDQPEGTVLNQDPVGGSEVSAGTTINVIIAGTEMWISQIRRVRVSRTMFRFQM